jgi:hypothetical protein
VRGNGAGDLQKGERLVMINLSGYSSDETASRYCNMDYIALSAMIGIMLPWIIITYDIGCQWSKNLTSRMKEFPEHMRISNEVKVEVAVPSWHINGHGQKSHVSVTAFHCLR